MKKYKSTKVLEYIKQLITHTSKSRMLYYNAPKDTKGKKLETIKLEDVENKISINALEFKVSIRQDINKDTRQSGIDRFSLSFTFDTQDIVLALYYFQELHKKYGNNRPVYLEVDEKHSKTYIESKGLNHVDPLYLNNQNIKAFNGEFDRLRHIIITSGAPILTFSYHTKNFINFTAGLGQYFNDKDIRVSSRLLDTTEGLIEYAEMAIGTIEGISYKIKEVI